MGTIKKAYDVGVENVEGKTETFIRLEPEVNFLSDGRTSRTRQLSFKQLADLFPDALLNVTEVQYRSLGGRMRCQYYLTYATLSDDFLPYDHNQPTLIPADAEAFDHISRQLKALQAQYGIKE